MAVTAVLEINFQDLITKEKMNHGIHDLVQRLIIKLGALIAISIGNFAALIKLLYKKTQILYAGNELIPVHK